MSLDPQAVRDIVRRALAEDLGPDRLDVTSVATIPAGQTDTGDLVARADGVVAGLDVAAAVFDEASELTGEAGSAGTVAFEERNRAVPFICYRKIEVAITVKIRQHNGTRRVSHGVGRAGRFFQQKISTAVK